MKKLFYWVAIQCLVFCAKAQENSSISFSNDCKDVYHLSLIIYTPDGKIQTRVSNLNPGQVKSYTLPDNSEIFIADWKQEAYAMKGNDPKSIGAKPAFIIKDSRKPLLVPLSSLRKPQ